ncbi:uncharacterized protein LOC142340330 [Convolutriloba macropyga]|uniref:uncharacterized protein LOC142340330 n=1 Tax=Convolutriloba macropyga TaxID=536237 RepID=UPI003F521A3C
MRAICVIFCILIPCSAVLTPLPPQWDMQEYIIPGNYSTQSAACALYSKFYCLNYVQITGKQSESLLERANNEEQDFLNRVWLFFNYTNWFSFNEHDKKQGGCCSKQLNFYKTDGKSRGLTALQYTKKVTNFTTEGKQLLFVKVDSR